MGCSPTTTDRLLVLWHVHGPHGRRTHGGARDWSAVDLGSRGRAEGRGEPDGRAAPRFSRRCSSLRPSTISLIPLLAGCSQRTHRGRRSQARSRSPEVAMRIDRRSRPARTSPDRRRRDCSAQPTGPPLRRNRSGLREGARRTWRIPGQKQKEVHFHSCTVGIREHQRAQIAGVPAASS